MRLTRLVVGLVLVGLSAALGQWLEREVVLGDTLGGISMYAGGIVVNPTSGNVYTGSDPVQVFNPVTMEKLRGPGAYGVVAFCPTSGKGYVFNRTAVIIDAATDTVIGTTALPFEPDEVTCSPTSRRLYLAAFWSDTLLSFDPDGDSVLHKVDVGGSVTRLLWDSAWNRLYIGADSDSGLLKVLDCTADTLLQDVRTGVTRVWSLALSTVSHKLYCSGEYANHDYGLVVVNSDSLHPVDTVPEVIYSHYLVYSPVTDRLFVPYYPNDLWILDCRNDSVRAHLVLPILGHAAVGSGGRVYFGHHDSAQVMVVDTTDSVVGSISVPTIARWGVEALTYSTDCNKVYGVMDGNGVFVVDASCDTLLGYLSYEVRTPYRMVHNPAGCKLYLACPGARGALLALDSTFRTPKLIPGAVTTLRPVPILDEALNRLYVADGYNLRVIDCNSDSLIESKPTDGTSSPVPLMVPYLEKLYVFSGGNGGGYVYAYDCLRDTVVPVAYLSHAVTCAVYDPRSNRVFFGCGETPAVRAFDPVSDTVSALWDLGGASVGGRMALNADLGRLYYTNQASDRLYTIDVLTNLVIASESLPWDVEALFLNRRLGKLYLVSSLEPWALVFDCKQGAVVDTFGVYYSQSGQMNDRNDKLYLKYGAVVDCRYDSVITMLPPWLDPCSMAWDAVNNRVFQATTSRLYVYRDGPYGIEVHRVELRAQRCATIIRRVLVLAGIGSGTSETRSSLMDISGRKVLDLRPGANDVRALAPGVYFVRGGGRGTGDAGPIRKVVLTR